MGLSIISVMMLQSPLMVKPIQGKNFMTPLAHFEKRYAITEQGQIINLANNQPLKPTENENGYLKVGLATGDGGHVQELVHIHVS